MAKSFYVRVDDNHLLQYEENGLDAAAAAARKACAIGAELSRRLAPRKTGALQGSIRVGTARGRRGSGGQATIEMGAPYGVFQEFGTSRGVEGKHMILLGIKRAREEWPALVDRELPG